MDPGLYPKLLQRWKDNPTDPDRPLLSNADVQRLLASIDPRSHTTDLGGSMSLNVKLDPAGIVLRVHQPFESRQRVLAVQQVRQQLAGRGLTVPVAIPWHGSTVFRCGIRWAEIEMYIPHERAAHNYDSYYWMFSTLGALHRELATLDIHVPQPPVATYAPPGSLRRWLPVTEAAVRGNQEAEAVARLLRELVGRLRRQWTPASSLPQQFIHGDARLSNICRTSNGETLYLDFGFLAYRPRVHDLAYALAFMVRALQGNQALEGFGWQHIPQLLATYEAHAHTHLTAEERRALIPCIAAVPLHAAALDGFSNDPPAQLRSRLPFLRLSEWLLKYPETRTQHITKHRAFGVS